MKSNISFVNAYMAFFIIHTSQIGMGILGVPKIIYLESKKDALDLSFTIRSIH